MIRRGLLPHLRIAIVLAAGTLGALSVPLALGASGRRPQLQQQDFELTPRDAVARPLRPGEVLSLPALFGDHDLWLSVDVPEQGELDVVFRKVEHRADSLQPECHARFAVLRLSSALEGPPFRTREEALFGREPGGVRVRAGQPVTVRLEVRGREVRANVGGRELSVFETADGFGNLALLARGELPAAIHALKIAVRPGPRWPVRVQAGIVAAIAAAAAAAFLLARRAPPLRVLLAAGFLPLGALAGRDLVLQHLAAMSEPTLPGLLLAALAGLPCFVLLARSTRAVLRLLLGLLLGALLLELGARAERDRLEPLADPRLDLQFDEASGTAAFDAYSGWLRGKSTIHRPIDPRPHVLLLGGQEAIWEIGPSPGGWASRQLQGELLALRPGLPAGWNGVATTATRFGHAFQQRSLLEWFLDLNRPEWFRTLRRPDVVVFGISRYVAEPRLETSPREWSTTLSERLARRRPTLLWALNRRPRTGSVPAATPSELQETLREVALLCRSRGIALVFATDAALPEPLADAVRAVSAETRVRLVPVVIDAVTQEPRVGELARAVAEFLP